MQPVTRVAGDPGQENKNDPHELFGHGQSEGPPRRHVAAASITERTKIPSSEGPGVSEHCGPRRRRSCAR